MEVMKLFPKGCKINTQVVFPGEYRIGYEWGGKKYVPGSGSYYDFDTALYKCWEALLANHSPPMLFLSDGRNNIREFRIGKY